MARYVITGTGTDIGKTVLSAGLCGFLGYDYWKPLQTGVAGNLPNAAIGKAQHPLPDTDADVITRLAAVRTHPETWALSEPLSPHRAAELDGISIDPDRIDPPADDALIIEGAGGVLVPVTRQVLFADLFARWQIPVILAAGTGLGTISYSLTALESLRARGVPVHGVAFIGEDNPDNIATIGQIGRVRVLGRLPILPTLTRDSLQAAMAQGFDKGDFA